MNTTTIECYFCGEIGHYNNQCDHHELHNLWSHIVNIIVDYRGFNEEEFAIQARFLQRYVPHDLVVAIAIRFCNFTYTCSSSYYDIMMAIYNGLSALYLEMANEADISEMISESIEMFDPDQAIEDSQWTIEPLLLCLETAEELKEEIFCAICLDNHTKLATVTTNCGHEFGKACMCAHLDHQFSTRSPTCPMCRTEVKTLEIKDADFYDELYERYVTVPLSAVPVNMPHDLESISDIALLDSFDFMPEGIF